MTRKRLLFCGVLFIMLFSGTLARLFFLALQGASTETAVFHGNYSIKIAVQRGAVYDRNHVLLVNTQTKHVAAVLPLRNAAAQLKALMPHVSGTAAVLSQMELGHPFVTQVDSTDILTQGIRVVDVKLRYDNEGIAPHVIGYVDSDSKGLSGIEKAYDKQLLQSSKTVVAHFAVDALGRTLKGVPVRVTGTGRTQSGVVLTLDKNIQLATQKAAKKGLKSGAALVMDAKTGDILASVSMPTFSQNDVAASLKAANSPLINRTLCAYNVGSVFKVVLAARALETGVDTNFTYTCTGKIRVAGKKFTCEKAHGALSMQGAVAQSCNTYFINLGQKLGGSGILSMARKLGFGESLRLAPGLYSDKGNLPTQKSLLIPGALANFSFGQGDLMATPVQVARMMCAVANGGLLPTPRLVEGLSDADGKPSAVYQSAAPVRVMSAETSQTLQKFLVETVETGTGKAAKPTVGGAGGKTSTAQTGWKRGKKTMTQAWFAGFYPAQSPRYVIVVVAENGVSGAASAAPVFRGIADGIARLDGTD